MSNVIANDFTDDPYAHLAAAIIIKAFEDLESMEGLEKSYLDRSPVTKDGLLNFFSSRWCSILLCFQNSVTQNDLMQAALKICD